MWTRTIYILAVQIFAVGGLLLSVTQPLLAHGVGGQLRIADHQIGPYAVSVWTTPSILRPGAVHVETAVTRGGGSVIDCAVQVSLTPKSSSDPTITAIAGPATVDNDFRHEAAFQIERSGRYNVEVSMLDAVGRGGQVTMEIEVMPVALWFQTLLYGLLTLSVLMGLFLVRQGFFIINKVRATGV